jgi:hypothetical protein
MSCFIIMPFKDELRPVCDAIKDAIKEVTRGAGQAIRADDIFRPGHVVNQLKEAIREADFCVADITGNNPNVMWEVGYARAMKKEVIPIRQGTEDIPFDIRADRMFTYSPRALPDLIATLKTTIATVAQDIAKQRPFLGWRHDELAHLQATLKRSALSKNKPDLLEVLSAAVLASGHADWSEKDASLLMKAIRTDTTAAEHQDAFW